MQSLFRIWRKQISVRNFGTLAERHSVTSIVAVPIHTKDTVLGAFVSLSSESRIFTNEDLTTASAVADFTAIALENANLFAELQRTAITDSLTGVYNAGFFSRLARPRNCASGPLRDTSFVIDDRCRQFQARE